MSIKEIMDCAEKTLGDVKLGSIFEVSKLVKAFDKDIWDDLNPRERSAVTCEFKMRLQSGKYPDVRYSGKSKSNHDRFIKIELN